MLMEHAGERPRVAPSAYVAPTATLCGDVTIGEGVRVLFGAVVVAEGGPVTIGAECIIMEHAVIRGVARHPTRLGDHILVGPHAHLTGCIVDDDVFIATGAAVFNGAHLGARAEVRVNGVVHLRTALPPDATAPIGWVAVGDPAEIVPPADHARIWALMEPLHFPRTVFGLERPAEGISLMPSVTRRYGRALGRHQDDRPVSDDDNWRSCVRRPECRG